MASRKEQREQARAERQAREAAEAAAAQRRTRMLQLAGALLAAAVIVIVAIVVSSSGSSSKNKGASGGGDVAGATQSAQLLNGVPQNGITLGSPKAKVTMLEFADLQCPFCQQYTLSQFPSIVAKYVKTGKVRMVFQNYAFIGPDSLTAARAAEAAGKQNKLWNFIDVFYNNQGQENSNYVTDAFLKKIAQGAGVNVTKMLADRQDPKVDQAIALAQQSAQRYGVNSTPTFIVKAPGKPQQKLSADQVDAALAKATAGL